MGEDNRNINNHNQHASATFTTTAANSTYNTSLAAEVENITTVPNTEIGKAIVCFQYVERIKSELIIAAKLIDRLNELSGDELTGAARMYSFFLEALQGEINIAYNVLGMKDFETAGAKVEEAIKKAHSNQYEETIRLLSEGISHVASSGQWAMQTLKDNGFL